MRYFLIHSVTFLFLVSQLWTSAISYVCYMNDGQTIVEFCDSSESEEESKKHEKKKDHKYRLDVHLNKRESLAINRLVKVLSTTVLRTLHHPEILTPPPESNFLSIKYNKCPFY